MKNGPYNLMIAPYDYPGKRYRSRYAYEHHIVWWQNGKKLPIKGYVIHHKNGDHRDNRIVNLELLSVQHHSLMHASKPWTYVFDHCDKCKKLFRLKGSHYRTRIKQSTRLFCSRSCQISLTQAARWGFVPG